MVHVELYNELKESGFDISHGQMGKTSPPGASICWGCPQARLRLKDAVVEVTGLRNPCGQPNKVQPELLDSVLDQDEDGNPIRKAGIMGVVVTSREVAPGDPVEVELPPEPYQPLEPV